MNCEDDPNPEQPPHCGPPSEEPKPTPPQHHDKEPPGDSRCKRLAKEVNAELRKQSKLFNRMKPLEGEPEEFKSRTLDIPKFVPWVEIRWGNSNCDCIESDDTEIMFLTIGNPYDNLTLSELTVERISLLQGENNPIAKLPNGTPCVDITPLGPYYFGDIPPGGQVSRQFVMRLRGSMSGEHRLLLDGICFNACVHADNNITFKFNICAD